MLHIVEQRLSYQAHVVPHAFSLVAVPALECCHKLHLYLLQQYWYLTPVGSDHRRSCPGLPRITLQKNPEDLSNGQYASRMVTEEGLTRRLVD